MIHTDEYRRGRIFLFVTQVLVLIAVLWIAQTRPTVADCQVEASGR